MDEQHKKQFLQDLAKSLALHCFRNTYLETLHAKLPGFTDDEMKRLMTNVVDQTYSFLHLFLNEDKRITDNFAEYLGMTAPPAQWSQPKLNESLVRTIAEWPTTKHTFANGAPRTGP